MTPGRAIDRWDWSGCISIWIRKCQFPPRLSRKHWLPGRHRQRLCSGRTGNDRRLLSALEATALQRRLVLTGVPGSGKTTFVNRLCLALARAEWKDLERWPKRELGRLPVLVILRDFAQWIASRPTLPEACAELLWEFIEHDLKRRKLDFAGELVEQALEKGQIQVFLDGLDEAAVVTANPIADS